MSFSTSAAPPFELGPDDPEPVTVINADSGTPLLLLCDHASNALPASLQRLGLSEDILMNRHIAWDIGAADVTRRLAKRFRCAAVLAGYSRLLIDCNRPPGDPESIPEVSDGVVIPGNRNIDARAAEARAAAFFWPYHQAVGTTLAQLWRGGEPPTPPAVVVIHSFTPQFDGRERPWQIGLLWNHDPRLVKPLLNWFASHRPEICVGDNEPYSGREIAFTLERHAAAAGLPHLAVELRQDLITSSSGCAYWAELLGDALQTVLRDRSLYRVQHY